jgi:hypothetical protein
MSTQAQLRRLYPAAAARPGVQPDGGSPLSGGLGWRCSREHIEEDGAPGPVLGEAEEAVAVSTEQLWPSSFPHDHPNPGGPRRRPTQQKGCGRTGGGEESPKPSLAPARH